MNDPNLLGMSEIIDGLPAYVQPFGCLCNGYEICCRVDGQSIFRFGELNGRLNPCFFGGNISLYLSMTYSLLVPFIIIPVVTCFRAKKCRAGMSLEWFVAVGTFFCDAENPTFSAVCTPCTFDRNWKMSFFLHSFSVLSLT